mmetsp:Transcript_45728/g.52711  ORF Transcript_45728/g.52711 Transcript_45728/m.52711 type:complete len:210 (-) Transcript_45728:2016-2645(-)
MINGSVQSLLRNIPVSPFFIQLNNASREASLGQFNGSLVGVSLLIGSQSSFRVIHSFKEVSSLFVHAGVHQSRGNLFHNFIITGEVVVHYNSGSLGGHSTLQVEVDGFHVVAFSLLQFGGFVLQTTLDAPIHVFLFEIVNIRAVGLFSNSDGLIPSLELVVHVHSLINFVMIQQDGFGAMELLLQHGQFGLNKVEFHTVIASLLLVLTD